MTHAEEKHRKETAKKLSNEGKKYFDLIEFDADEELVTEIRKHPFGLFVIWATGIFIAIVLFMMSIAVVSFDFNDLTNGADTRAFEGITIFACLLLIIGTIVGTFIASFLYKSNVIYVTNEKIAQVLYVGLFHRKISQLSIGDVQDVTVRQNGIFAHAYKYGTLVVETAGEQQNYTFSYVPHPYQQSKYIVGAHERNLAKYGN